MIEKISYEKMVLLSCSQIQKITEMKEPKDIGEIIALINVSVLATIVEEVNNKIDEINVLYEKVEKLSKAKQENDGR